MNAIDRIISWTKRTCKRHEMGIKEPKDVPDQEDIDAYLDEVEEMSGFKGIQCGVAILKDDGTYETVLTIKRKEDG